MKEELDPYLSDAQDIGTASRYRTADCHVNNLEEGEFKDELLKRLEALK